MSLLKIFRRYPALVQSFQAGTLMAGGDAISQFGIERKTMNEFDWIRPIRFFSIGFVVMGPTLRVWYGFLDKKFGSSTKIGVLKKVAFDQMIFSPCMLGVFLAILGITQHKQMREIKENIKNNYTDILIAGYSVWPAVQLCNFSFIPLRHQVLVVQMISLLWNTYLAWKTNQEKVIEQPQS